ncbi:MAG: HNH endonuclease, partial [Thermoleophilia bacterium]|nr:HNH endonuclease [Thermoleophilia bacterium]
RSAATFWSAPLRAISHPMVLSIAPTPRYISTYAKMPGTMWLTCANCGRLFRRNPSDVRKNKSGLFYCSPSCRFEAWRGPGNPNYEHRWSDAQRAAMAEAKRGTPAWNKGRTAGDSESVRKYADKLLGNTHGRANRGKPSPLLSERNRLRNPAKRPEVRAKLSAAMKLKTGSRNSNWKGGSSYFRGAEWRRIRQQALDRDHHRCRACGKTEQENGRQLHVHHIVPWEESKDNSLGNLVSLCIGCHTKISAGTLQCPTNT